MPTGDGIHSFGHGPVCVYCGWDPDTEPERLCDERLDKKCTADEVAALERLDNLGEAIGGVGFEVGLGLIELDECIPAIEKLIADYRRREAEFTSPAEKKP